MVTPWSDRIDRLTNVFKWPAAVLAVAATPLLAWALGKLLLRVAATPWNIVPFAVGAVLFVLLWRRWLATNSMGRFLITLEHELTHAFFAFLTLHRIVGFRASIRRGGTVKFIGKGNWLIAAAPYFFPTAALLLFLIAFALPFQGLPWRSILLGVALGYHCISTYRETHRDQSDIRLLGSTFCWLFLPAANLAVVGLLVSYAHGGTEGMSDWWNDISQPVGVAYAWSKSYFNV